MRRFFSTLVYLILAVGLFHISAAVYDVNTIPDPKQQGQDYYVCNPDGVLSSDAAQKINDNSVLLEKETEVELCVVAIDNFNEEKYGDAYEFALDLFNLWGIGKAGLNNGVLLFLASGSRDVQIITGGGVEGLLPDITCGQIIDDNLDYLSQGDFNTGIENIARSITKHLTTSTAMAELLLGYKPKQVSYTTFNYFIIGFVILIILAFIGYKRLNGVPGQSKKQIQQQAAAGQTASGFLSFVFPFPILLFYLYYRYARKNVKPIPPVCNNCGNQQMQQVSDDVREQYLTPVQLAEERLKSMEYEVWQCPDCKTIEILSAKGSQGGKYDVCPTCGAHAYETTDRLTLQRATYTSTGKRRDTKTCAYCGHVGTVLVTLPILVQTAPSTSSHGSRGGFGGGSGSGSWGGGSSFGGGAGRKF